jgi:DNA-binding NarL/FixJ family response regulator
MTDDLKVSDDLPPAGRRTRVLIVDDHAIMREGLVRLLQTAGDLEIVGSAADGQTAIDMTRDLSPDVVVMDMSMPGMSGTEATRIIVSRFPSVRVIGLSMYSEAEMGARMRIAGAASYVEKTSPAEVLISAIRTAQPPKHE